jgi:hypothetical protein
MGGSDNIVSIWKYWLYYRSMYNDNYFLIFDTILIYKMIEVDQR